MARNFTLKQIYARGERLYKKLAPRLGSRSKGRILALEPESGKYVIGRNELVVANQARKRYPGKVFTVFRIGHPAVHKFRKS